VANTPPSVRPLDGLVAVVTGGAGHLGTEMTATLARRGATVVVADIDGQRADKHAAALVRDGFTSFAVEVDVASEGSVAAAFTSVVDEYGGVDVLVNNAAPTSAVAHDGSVMEVSLDTWETVLRGILGGTLICSRRAIPLLAERGGGSIVNIASVHAHAADLDLTAYPVAKAGLLGLTRTIATQCGGLGIRCNSISLGTIAYPDASAEWLQHKLRHQVVAHQGRPADAANLVAFLASPEAAFVTGADFVADGGVLAHLPAYADAGARITRMRDSDGSRTPDATRTTP
jgi:NAD(P)-dependent dehydrogenase (short-subunit alcohol dehydrogenase family)